MPNQENNNANDAVGGRQHDASQSHDSRVEENSLQQPSTSIRALGMAAQYFPLQQPSSHQQSPSHGNDTGTANTAATDQSTESLEQQRRSLARIERENFLLFIKILFKILDENPTAKSRAQRIVMECRRRNQQGDPNYDPLMDGVERHLRVFVGEANWRKSHMLLHHYIVNKRGRPDGASPTNRGRPGAILVGE